MRAKMCALLRGALEEYTPPIVHLTPVAFFTVFTTPKPVITSNRAGLSVSASTVVSWKEMRVKFSSRRPRFAP